MKKSLEGRKVAILVDNGFERSELHEPRRALDQEGAKTMVVSPSKDRVRAWKSGDWADEVAVDVPLAEARPEDFDAILLPGGVINPDRLRVIPEAVRFVKAFFDAGKPIAAICHGPWTLIEVGAPKGRTMTSWPSLRTDLTNAGARWVDQEVVVDQGIVTSRKPEDIPAFNPKMIEAFAAGAHAKRRAA